MSPAYSGLRSGHPNPVVCGRKFCSKCGRWRHIVDFDVQRARGREPRLRSWCRTCQRVYNRGSNARRSEQQRELAREYQRIWHEVQRRRAGIPPRNWRRRLPVERIFLDPAPLLSAMDLWIKAQPEPSWKALARQAGLEPRAIQRLRHGESQHVRIDIADRLALAIEVPLSLIYVDEWRRDG